MNSGRVKLAVHRKLILQDRSDPYSALHVASQADGSGGRGGGTLFLEQSAPRLPTMATYFPFHKQ